MWDLIVPVPDHCLSFYFNLKNRSLKDTTKALLKGPKNDLKNCETRGQKLLQLYHLQFDAAETCQNRPFELRDYCE